MGDRCWRFVHITDTHFHPDPAYLPPWVSAAPSPLEAAQTLVAQIRALPFTPDFVLHTGDVAYAPDTAAYHVARQVLAGLPAPVYFVNGNHDSAELLQSVLLGRAVEAVQAPFNYSLDLAGLQLVVLDSAVNDDHAPAIPAETLYWLERQCNPADLRPLVIAVHHGLVPVGVPWLDGRMRAANGERVHEILRGVRHRLRGVFFGHVHQSIDVVRDGILYCAAPSAWYQLHAHPDTLQDEQDFAAQPGFNVVTVTESHTFVRRYAFSVAQLAAIPTLFPVFAPAQV